MVRWRFFLLLLLLILAGCSEGAVVFAPTPLPPEVVPSVYDHPSGAFRILLPRTWSLYEQANAAFAAASFSPPNSASPVVQVYVVNFGRAIELDEIGGLMDLYQRQFRADLARYTEQDRQAMGDGSWRIAGVRRTPSGATQQVNTFVQRNGTLFAVIEITLPIDATQRSQVQTFINTFELRAEADLPVADISVFSTVAPIELEVVNVTTWTTIDGVFFVTGEVANHSDRPIASVPIRAILQTADGSPVADASNNIMGHAIQPGSFAPFSIRFGQGQPVNALNYTVILGSSDAQVQEIEVISAPTLTWTDEIQYTADGDLFITGTISNRGSADVQMPRATATVFDERGRVIGAGFVDTDMTVLPANGETPFTILISDLGGTAANYIVHVQALPCADVC
jgi:hypothetical protein